MTTTITTTVPKSSPWGAVQGGEVLAQGIVSVYTAGHGGIKLDAVRNAQVPAEARNAGGWYEEDCEWSIPALCFPEAFPDRPGMEKSMAQYAKESCQNYFPEAYTAITGETVTLEQSSCLRERDFKARTQTQYVVSSAFGSWAAWVPEGKVGVCAFRASDSTELWALVKAERYQARTGAYVLDLDIDCEIVKPLNINASKEAR